MYIYVQKQLHVVLPLQALPVVLLRDKFLFGVVQTVSRSVMVCVREATEFAVIGLDAGAINNVSVAIYTEKKIWKCSINMHLPIR